MTITEILPPSHWRQVIYGNDYVFLYHNPLVNDDFHPRILPSGQLMWKGFADVV